MYIEKLLLDTDKKEIKAFAISTATVASSSVLLLYTINNAAESTSRPLPQLSQSNDALIFIIALILFSISSRTAYTTASHAVSRKLLELRMKLINAVTSSDLATIENLGAQTLFSIISHKTEHLANNLSALVLALQNCVILSFALAYVFYISLAGGTLFVASATAGVLLYYIYKRNNEKADADRSAIEREAADFVSNFTDGFQEMRLNQHREDAMFCEFLSLSTKLREVTVSTSRYWANITLFSNAYLFALLGISVTVMPIFFESFSDDTYKIITATIFMIGPLIGISSSIPLYNESEQGIQSTVELIDYLDNLSRRNGENSYPVTAKNLEILESISLDSIAYEYKTPNNLGNGFSIGPITITIKSGETIFISGGNGSGKSTLLKVMTGLYEASSGSFSVNKSPTSSKSRDYRNLYSALFTDFYLFHKIYGIDDINLERADNILSDFNLDKKVRLVKRTLSTTALSTGQRKRLATLQMLLEDRQVLIFDEWAADQDEHFRNYFYKTMLPTLKAQGKTLIVVTHDDRYWHLSDRLFRMDAGTLSEITQNGVA